MPGTSAGTSSIAPKMPRPVIGMRLKFSSQLQLINAALEPSVGNSKLLDVVVKIHPTIFSVCVLWGAAWIHSKTYASRWRIGWYVRVWQTHKIFTWHRSKTTFSPVMIRFTRRLMTWYCATCDIINVLRLHFTTTWIVSHRGNMAKTEKMNIREISSPQTKNTCSKYSWVCITDIKHIIIWKYITLAHATNVLKRLNVRGCALCWTQPECLAGKGHVAVS